MSDFGYSAGGNRFASGVTTSCTTGAVNTKGSWTQIIASAPFDACGFYLSTRPGGGTSQLLMDIGIGASGSEVIIAPDLFFSSEHTGGDLWDSIVYIPLRIKSGTRVAIRAQCNIATRSPSANIMLVADAGGVFPSFGTMTAYNIDSSISSVVRFWSAGNWQEMTSSSVAASALLALMAHPNTNNAWECTLSIAVGASGSETALLEGVPILSRGNEAYTHRVNPRNIPLTPCCIPAGTRIAAKATTVGGSFNTFGLAVYLFN